LVLQGKAKVCKANPAVVPGTSSHGHPPQDSAESLFTSQSGGRAFPPFLSRHMFSLSRVGTADNLRISKKTLNRFNIYTHPFTPAATSLVLIKKRQLKQKEQPCGSKPKVLQLRILSQTASNDRVRGCKLRQQRSNLCPSSSSQSWSWTLPPHPATAKSHPQPSLNSSRPVLKPFLLLTSAKPCGNKIHHQARCQLGKPKPFLVLLSCEEGAEASRDALLDPS